MSVSDWLNDGSLVEGSRRNRRRTVAALEKSNGKTIEQIMSDVRNDRANVYTVSKRFIEAIRPTIAPRTLYLHRSMLPSLWESTIGENNFSRRTFDRLVPICKVCNL